MFTPAQLAAAVSPETAVTVQDYPYGFRLRCTLRAWVEFRKGKGFRYCTQTSTPKRPGTWNAVKAGTYSRVCMAIVQDENGHIGPVALSEYSDLNDYAAFNARAADNLTPDAAASLRYFWDVKKAYADKCAELGVENIYTTTPENQRAVKLAALAAMAPHCKAGTDY